MPSITVIGLSVFAVAKPGKTFAKRVKSAAGTVKPMQAHVGKPGLLPGSEGLISEGKHVPQFKRYSLFRPASRPKTAWTRDHSTICTSEQRKKLESSGGIPGTYREIFGPLVVMRSHLAYPSTVPYPRWNRSASVSVYRDIGEKMGLGKAVLYPTHDRVNPSTGSICKYLDLGYI
ncbi:hypothetical protein C8J57DRAFT_1229175 [Mycena rebaudengoi]|nr:hypothetical protein C8J57DRAFT_1229175 [Mycena rebaudengoi]